MLTFAGSVLRAVALALLAVSLLAAIPMATLRVERRIFQVVQLAGENARGAHARVLGAAAADALDSIRRTIPPGGEYLLLDGGAEEQAATFWVRFELAPRRARYVGRLNEMPGVLGSFQQLRQALSRPGGPRWVVIAFPRDPAVLLDRGELLRRMDASHGSL
ncbi:MAG TPA: hypothetical protein VGQ28_10445 [Thermoanaerobaculia bacterium]|nr:hypothetical protein [Thermoanaerobaculia bacterium]